jgi:hypothetical protein
MAERVDIVSAACALLSQGDAKGAAALLAERHPLERVEASLRAHSATEALGVFQRDGFIDRYSGNRLLFPGVLQVLSVHLPVAFPQPNWKVSETHFAYWELFPTIGHVRPVTRGGVDAPENWVTTSMLRNSAKASWTLEELGWRLHPPGDLARWDGLQSWFVSHVDRTPKLLESRTLRGWYQAAIAAGSVRP